MKDSRYAGGAGGSYGGSGGHGGHGAAGGYGVGGYGGHGVHGNHAGYQPIAQHPMPQPWSQQPQAPWPQPYAYQSMSPMMAPYSVVPAPVVVASDYHVKKSMNKMEWMFCAFFLFAGLGLLIGGLLTKFKVMILIGIILLGLSVLYFLARMTGACDNISCMICLGPGDCAACGDCCGDLAEV